jgi:hypothetical protein
MEAEAVQQWHDLEALSAAWAEQWDRAVARLRRCWEEIDTVLAAYNDLLSAGPAPEEVYVRLTRAQREALDLPGAEEAVAWLEDHWPPPGDRLESLFALLELGLTGL